MVAARLAHLRSRISQSPRTSASAGTVSNKPPSDASDGGPERNRKRPPNLAARHPVGRERVRDGRGVQGADAH